MKASMSWPPRRRDYVAPLAARAAGHPRVTVDGTLIRTDRCRAPGPTDPTGRAIDVSRSGWTGVDPSESLPLFRRSAATQPLPEPERGGSLDTLRDLLGL